MPDAGRTHGPPTVTTGSAETTGIPPRDGVDGCFARSPWSAGLDSLYRLQVRRLQAWSQRWGVRTMRLGRPRECFRRRAHRALNLPASTASRFLRP